VPFKSGRSGNPAGAPRRPHARTQRVRKIIADATGEIIEAIIKDAKNNDVAARQLFVKHLMPRHRFVAEPVDLSPAKDAAEAQAQIGMLVGMAGRGELDLDSLYSLSRALALAIDTRLAELEERLEEQEGQEPDDG
jgi:hypothetical protein